MIRHCAGRRPPTVINSSSSSTTTPTLRLAASAPAWLLRHVFRADLDSCPECAGPMRWLEAAATRQASERLLAKLGLAPRPPPPPRSDPRGQLELPFVG